MGSTEIFLDWNFKKCVNNLDANLYIQNQPSKELTILTETLKHQIQNWMLNKKMTKLTGDLSVLLLLRCGWRADVRSWNGWQRVTSLLSVLSITSFWKAWCNVSKSGTLAFVFGLKDGLCAKNASTLVLVLCELRTWCSPLVLKLWMGAEEALRVSWALAWMRIFLWCSFSKVMIMEDKGL